MSKFTTRVELHNARSAEDYETLHTEMQKEGFWRTIKFDGDPNEYQLPTAEYNYSDEVGAADVRDRAMKAAARTGKKYSVLVTKADGGRSIYNLQVVKRHVS